MSLIVASYIRTEDRDSILLRIIDSSLTVVDVRIILRWIFRYLEWVVGTGWSWLRIGTGGGHL
jgi:hypothetical protein